MSYSYYTYENASKTGNCLGILKNGLCYAIYVKYNGKNEYCNPSVENISKEIFLAMMVLFNPSIYPNLRIHKVTIYETPNCWTECVRESISDVEAGNWMKVRYDEVTKYALDKGVIEYDDRILN